MFDFSKVDENFEEKYNAEFEGYTPFKKGWYYKTSGNLIELKLHEGDRAIYEIEREEENHG